MEDETLHSTMLFDFFGDLLTEKQREYFDLYHNEDLSLSEIAEKAGISRQGVFDIISRAEKSLDELEAKTGIVRKWRENLKELSQAETIARELLHRTGDDKEMKELATRLVDILEQLNS